MTKYQTVYETAKKYLFEKTEGLTQEILSDYTKCERVSSVSEAFRIGVYSFNDWTDPYDKPHIDLDENKKTEIRKFCKDYDVDEFLKFVGSFKTEEELDDAFGKVFDEKKKVLLRRNIVDIAKYLSQFNGSADEMYKHFESFGLDTSEGRANLIKEINNSVFNWGSKRTPNWLKDIGMEMFSAPDVHLKEILSNLGLIKSDPGSNDDKTANEVVDVILAMAQECKEIEPDVTAFAIDRILWLIGSGKFFNNKELKYTGSKEDFCSKVKEELAKTGF